MIDNKPPQTYMHLHLDLKKLQMEEERRGVVERDNGILLDKMVRIMRTRGRVDNVNNYQQRRFNLCTQLQLITNSCSDYAQSKQDAEAEGFAASYSREPGHSEENPVQGGTLQPHAVGKTIVRLCQDFSRTLYMHLCKGNLLLKL